MPPASDVQEAFNLLAEYASDVIVRVGLDGKATYVSPAIRRFGYEPEAIVGTDGLDLIHPDDRGNFAANTSALLRGESDPDRNRQHRLRTADGDWVWIEGNPRVVRDEAGRAVGTVNVFRDVTRRVAAEAALRASEEQYRLIAEHSSDLVIVADLLNRITYVSPSVRRMGWKPSDFLGASYTDLLNDPDRAAVAAAHGRLMSGESEVETVRIKVVHGETRKPIWVEVRKSLMRDPANGAPVAYLDVTRDITILVEQEQALAEARAKADVATAAKTQFLANMSHEIRTPLTAVLGFSQLLAGLPGLGDTAESFVARISGAGNGLLAIVNDILDFSKLEAGKFEIRPMPTNLEDVCRETLSIFEAQADAKAIRLAFTREPGVAPTVMLDGERLRQVLINLVGNGVKFTQAGSVTVALRSGGSDGQIVVEVRDTGPGLDSEAQGRLFQRFSQVGGSDARGGTGLGLAITRGLAEAMGGSVSVTSAPGEGAAFSLTLPAPPCESSKAEDALVEAGSIAGARVLVVDDNAGNRDLVGRLLATMGAEVTAACDGAGALAQLASSPVDVVLLDLRMPGMNGDQVLTALRATDGVNSAVPVLAFTADADVAAATELARFSGLVRKPIELVEMLRAISTALSPPSAPDCQAGIAA